MFLRLQNSCSYYIDETYLEIKSDVFNSSYKIKGFESKSANCILTELQQGVVEKGVIEYLSRKSNCDKTKVNEFLDFLSKHSLLVKCEDVFYSQPENTLYDRQIRFLDSFERNLIGGSHFNNKLQNRKVVIVGLGAYGTWLAFHCARLGIKHIVGVDFDKVELSNLHRQILYSRQDIGKLKVEACKNLLTNVDPEITYEGHPIKIGHENDLISLLDNADLVFNAFGYYPEADAENLISGFITKACILTNTPMLCLSTNLLGPLYIPGKSACYFCTVTHPKLAPILIKNQKNKRVEKRAFSPVLSITCSLAVLDAVLYLSGISEPSTIDKLISIDPFQIYKSKFLTIIKKNDCNYCMRFFSRSNYEK